MHLVASLCKHFLDLPASSKTPQRWISFCSVQTTYISNSQGHNEIDRADAFLWKIIFYIFRFHEAALSFGSFNSTTVYPNFELCFFPHPASPLKILFSFFFLVHLFLTYNPTSMKICFTFILLCYQTLIIQNEDGIWLMVFTSVQQTSITIF